MNSVGIYSKADDFCTISAGTTVKQRVAAAPELVQVRML